MASRQQIKRRIGSIKSTKQITKAMQLVAASKLRRAQEAVARPRAYAEMARSILVRVRAAAGGNHASPLYEQRPVKRRLFVVVAGDRGLAGAYNANVIRRLIAELTTDRENGVQSSVVCIGRQATSACARIQGLEIKAVYQGLPDKPDADTLRPILTSVVDMFEEKSVDAVDIINTTFVSTVIQRAHTWRWLPAGVEDERTARAQKVAADVTIEPSAEVLLQSATMRLLEAQLYQALLDATASEHSMRMLAMKNATDNASDLIEDYTLEYNNARQAAITQELAEITGGAEALR
jgi:F-type H+-transporting ATPase subunit gamma